MSRLLPMIQAASVLIRNVRILLPDALLAQGNVHSPNGTIHIRFRPLQTALTPKLALA